MGLFDSIKQKGMEKMMQAALNSGPAKDLLKGKEGELAELMQVFQGKNLTNLMMLLQSAKPGQPITGEQVRQALDAPAVALLAAKMKVPPEQAHGKIADMINQMMAHMGRNG